MWLSRGQFDDGQGSMIDAQSLAVLDGASGRGRLGRKSERDMCPCLCTVHAAEQPAAIGSRIDDLRIERTESHRADVQCGQPIVRRSPGLAAVRGQIGRASCRERV